MTPEELAVYADNVMKGLKLLEGKTVSTADIQSLGLTVNAARLAVELATLKLAMAEEE